MVHMYFSRFDAPCFIILSFAISSNNTVLQVGSPDLAIQVLSFWIWCSRFYVPDSEFGATAFRVLPIRIPPSLILLHAAFHYVIDECRFSYNISN